MLVRRKWNNPGPPSKENNQQLYESMNEGHFLGGGGAAVYTQCVMADVSWLMSTIVRKFRLSERTILVLSLRFVLIFLIFFMTGFSPPL